MPDKPDKPDSSSVRASDTVQPTSASPKESAMPPGTPQNPPTQTETQVSSRKRQYMVGTNPASPLQTAGLVPFASNLMGTVEQALKDNPEVDYVKTIAPKGLGLLSTLGLGGLGPAAPPGIVVAKMDDSHAEALRQGGGGHLVVEQDRHLTYMAPALAPTVVTNPAVMPSLASSLTFTITVRSSDSNVPLPEAEVYLFGPMLPAQGVTDANGQATVTIFGATTDTLRGLFVNPKADYWGCWMPNPALDPNSNNVVTVAPLSEFFPGFPVQPALGWGQKAMRMDELPPQLNGEGARVAVIDSGAAANTHQNLHPLFKGGIDITNPANVDGWTDDAVGHGSHCSGIIAGLNTQHGIRGFAPRAEIYAYKIFPGGAFSDLIEALDDCINNKIDVVNLSLGSDQPSQLLANKFQQAKDAGVACIVAAGNSGGPVQFPALLPSVLAVSAVGKVGEFPPDSFHATQIAPPGIGPAGYFSASFSCFGPEVGVCAPGVAILSSVPPNNFAVWDGTSMATPHITGLATLILAHHPDFQPGGAFSARDGRRVDRLFQILKMSAQPVGLSDPARTGAGLPDAVQAFSITAQAGMPSGLSGQAGAQTTMGLFQNQPQPFAAQTQSLQPQSLWGDIGNAVGTAAQLGHQFGLFSAQPQLQQNAYPSQAGQLQTQSWLSDVSRIAQVAVPIAMSLLQNRPQMPIGQAQQASVAQGSQTTNGGQLETQSWLSDISSVTQVAVPIAMSLLQNRS